MWIYLNLSCLWFVELLRYGYPYLLQIDDIFSHYIFKYFSAPSSLSSPQTPIMHMFVCLVVSYRSCKFCSFLFLKKIFFNVYLFLRERERGKWGRDTEREGDPESEAGSRLRAVSTEPDVGLELMNHEIMTWAEVRRSTNWATQVPRFCSFLFILFSFCPSDCRVSIVLSLSSLILFLCLLTSAVESL